MGARVKAAYALVVEPDPVGLPSVSRLLGARGYQPVLTRSVDEAITAARQKRFAFTLLGAKVERQDFLRRLDRHGLDPGAIVVVAERGHGFAGPDPSSFSVDALIETPFTPESLDEVSA